MIIMIMILIITITIMIITIMINCLCRKPTSWIDSIPLRIWNPSLPINNKHDDKVFSHKGSQKKMFFFPRANFNFLLI